MNSLGNYSADRLADRAQITDVLHRYCRAVDRLDFELLRDVYHPDAIDEHGIYVGGPDGMVEWVRERHKGISFSMHMVSNILIEFAGPDTAIAETYYFMAQHYPAEIGAAAKVPVGEQSKAGVAVDVTAYGRYVDQFTRRSGVWKIQHRSCIADSMHVADSTAGVPKAAPATIWGRHDRTDCLYQVRKTLGLD
jgi:hypothetical protein